MTALGPAICGALSSIVTAFLVVYASRLFNTELFTWSIWVIVPVGAILTGFLAASGYYFGSKYFNSRPTRLLMLQVVVVAGLTQFLIYYLEYLEQGLASKISFFDYLPYWLTNTEYTIGHSASAPGFTLGNFGYALAGIQFLGFLFGGGAICGFLCMIPFCDRCDKYFTVLSKRRYKFAQETDAVSFQDGLAQCTENELKCESHLTSRGPQDNPAKDDAGVWKLDMKLQGCPSCSKQVIASTLTVFNGKEWTDTGSETLDVPLGVNLTKPFAKEK